MELEGLGGSASLSLRDAAGNKVLVNTISARGNKATHFSPTTSFRPGTIFEITDEVATIVIHRGGEEILIPVQMKRGEINIVRV